MGFEQTITSWATPPSISASSGAGMRSCWAVRYRTGTRALIQLAPEMVLSLPPGPNRPVHVAPARHMTPSMKGKPSMKDKRVSE